VGYRKQTIEKAVLNADYIIHLAGANIAEKPWTKRKEQIITSRNSLPTYLLRSKKSNKN
jgi:NAD dependent epimerase/dehydratase family enzyme